MVDDSIRLRRVSVRLQTPETTRKFVKANYHKKKHLRFKALKGVSTCDENEHQGKKVPINVILKEMRVDEQRPFYRVEKGFGVNKDNVLVIIPRKIS